MEMRKNNNYQFMLCSIIFITLLSSFAQATSHYSFNHAEELKSLVHWREYNADTFNEAQRENKPIFLLLTAPSWCYYCQVYESEDYLFNSQVVKILNEEFIPIYVDADKRQDLTRQYLEGGWPSTTVMTPAKLRLFGYSGIRPIENIVANLKKAVTYVQANPSSSNVSYRYEKITPVIPTEKQLSLIVDKYTYSILQLYDPEYGGFGSGQKFPQGRTEEFALEEYERTGNKQFLQVVQNTLRNEYTNISEITKNYHLFDPVEGGFHRYGTQRTWSPPHYEKMLYDNARLLKTYSHLLMLTPNDALVQEVVHKTDVYIRSYWYDNAKGGFYGNTDVHGESNYYGKNPRPTEKPRVEKTKYADWNSEAILTYLYLWNETKNDTYKTIAEKSLSLYGSSMITNQGVVHYLKEDGTAGLSGNLVDNSYGFLAFTEAYEITGNTAYLSVAENIANYTLDTLYDWNSGGFFERRSMEKELYAPGENIILAKPVEENGIMAYGLLKLYRFTHNPVYLNAGLKTIGNQIISEAPLDNGYYFAKSAQFAIDSNLLRSYEQEKEHIEKIEQMEKNNFWLTSLLENSSNLPFQPTEDGTQKNEGSLIILLFVAFIGGLISFLSPCTLPILPAYLGLSFRSSKQNIKLLSFSFFIGLILVFIFLGMSATFVGNFLREHLTIFSQIAGALIMLFGGYILFGKSVRSIAIQPSKPTSYLSAFLFGAALGISWTPCVGPILLAILLLASTTNSFAIGGLLLFIYGLGLSLPLIFLAVYLEKINKESILWKFLRGKELKFKFENSARVYSIHTTSLISGLLFLTIGYLIFSGSLITFNKYIYTTPFQNILRHVENWLLNVAG